MSGRGDGRLFHPSSNPVVTIGLTLSTSSPTLDPTSPFYIVVTARILSTPHPEKSITLATHLNPLKSLQNGSFSNIICTSSTPAAALNADAKYIEVWPRGWPHYLWDPDDLRKSWEFITIPAQGQGQYVVKHEVPQDRVLNAGVLTGEMYKVSLTNKCLGTRWWMFGALDDVREGEKFRQWRRKDTPGGDIETETGESPSEGVFGERPDDLALVPEVGEVEFIIG